MNYGSIYLFAGLVYGSFGITALVASAHGFAVPRFAPHALLVVFGTLVAIPIHEAGHWLAGVSHGFRCLRFTLGPLEVTPVDGTWRLRLIPFRHAGVVHQVPPSFTHFRLQKATCLAAGPGVSLIACLLFTRLALRSTGAFAFWFWAVNAQMCLVGVLQLFPVRLGGVESDGLQLWKIAQGGAAVDGMQRDLLAESVNHTALRPREWPADLIRRMERSARETGGSIPAAARYSLYMAYVHSLDSGNIPAAWSHLEPILDSWTPGDGPQYALEAAYFLAFHRADVERARQWLALESRLPTDSLRLRAEAAVEWAAGHSSKALQLIGQAESTVRASGPCGNREFEMDCLNAMREEMAARSLAQPQLVEMGWELRAGAAYRPMEPVVSGIANSAPSSC